MSTKKVLTAPKASVWPSELHGTVTSPYGGTAPINPSLKENLDPGQGRNTAAWVETLRLTPAEALAVYRELRPLIPRVCNELALVAMADEITFALRRGLSTRVRNAIESFALRSVVIQVIEGWPIDSLELPETPSHRPVAVGSIALYAMIQVGYCVLRGERPISYVHENSGKLIRHVTPKITEQSAVSSHGSIVLGPHTDNSHKPISSLEPIMDEAPAPETLTLFSLRSEINVPTMFAPVEKIVARLPPDVAHKLASPVFQFPPPKSFASSATTFTGPLLILGNRKFARYSGQVSAPKGEFQNALIQFQNELKNEDLWLPILLLAGASVCWKQNEALHARAVLSPRFDGGDRWLLRVYGLPACYVKPVHEDVPFLLF